MTLQVIFQNEFSSQFTRIARGADVFPAGKYLVSRKNYNVLNDGKLQYIIEQVSALPDVLFCGSPGHPAYLKHPIKEVFFLEDEALRGFLFEAFLTRYGYMPETNLEGFVIAVNK